MNEPRLNVQLHPGEQTTAYMAVSEHERILTERSSLSPEEIEALAGMTSLGGRMASSYEVYGNVDLVASVPLAESALNKLGAYGPAEAEEP